MKKIIVITSLSEIVNFRFLFFVCSLNNEYSFDGFIKFFEKFIDYEIIFSNFMVWNHSAIISKDIFFNTLKS